MGEILRGGVLPKCVCDWTMRWDVTLTREPLRRVQAADRTGQDDGNGNMLSYKVVVCKIQRHQLSGVSYVRLNQSTGTH